LLACLLAFAVRSSPVLTRTLPSNSIRLSPTPPCRSIAPYTRYTSFPQRRSLPQPFTQLCQRELLLISSLSNSSQTLPGTDVRPQLEHPQSGSFPSSSLLSRRGTARRHSLHLFLSHSSRQPAALLHQPLPRHEPYSSSPVLLLQLPNFSTSTFSNSSCRWLRLSRLLRPPRPFRPSSFSRTDDR
jgi:hypothetical protein